MSNSASHIEENQPLEDNKILPMINLNLKEGDIISDRYKVVYEIARTKLSAIYVADDTRLSRKVALKHIFQTADSQNFKSLMNEAQLLSTMSHPNVLTVFDCNVDDKGAYIISEYLRGKTLEDYPKKDPISVELFVSFTEQMLMGLSEAHKQGIIHGDIKPNNVMVEQRPSGRKQIKLLDFGLSRMTYQDDDLKKQQPMEGSAYFMAPEEFNGEAKSIASDIYSLGCVCYYIVTGRYPFNGDNTMQIMAAHMQHVLHDPSVYRPDFPVHMNEWIMWMINLKPESRASDASEALQVLTTCFEHYKRSQAKQEFLKEQVKDLIHTKNTLEETSGHSLQSKSPEAAEWSALRTHALRSFSKLIDKQQAIRLMIDILDKHNFSKNSVVPKDQRRKVITDYFDLVPNKSKRALMLQEVEDQL